MKDQFTIGQMSKLYDIPVKTLRYYDEIGLFTPYHTDGVTGYRYYRAEQFQQLDMISFLKDLGVPLKEIKQKLEHSTLDQFLHTLEKYEETTRRKMNELQTTHRHLTQKIQQLQLAKTTERVLCSPLCQREASGKKSGPFLPWEIWKCFSGKSRKPSII
ncbi:MerR family transcriptional regulator [Rossellomorea sp. H39__3]